MAHISKLSAERHQRILAELSNQPGNDVCADCKTRNPRWASYNLGIFLCMSCASIHRKIGTHISKVKSITLDSWTKEQVETMKQVGNIKSNAYYNPHESRHPPPTNIIDSERDSDLEKYIRSKYEFKKFVDRSAFVASKLGPSQSLSSRIGSNPSPTNASKLSERVSHPQITQTTPSVTHNALQTPTQSIPATQPALPAAALQSTQPQASASNPLWNDLASLQSSGTNASLPLQYAPPQLNSAASLGSPLSVSGFSSSQTPTNPYSNLSASPASPLPYTLMNQQTGVSSMGLPRSMSLNTGLSIQAGSNFNSTSFSPSFQPSPGYPQTPMAQTPIGGNPSPNPFAPQALPASNGMSFGTPSPSFNMMSPGVLPSPSPLLQTMPQQQYPVQQQQQSQMFQPQGQSMQLQVPQSMTPFMPSPSPQLQPSYSPAQQQYMGSTPSPYATAQSLPQMQQPQQPTTNPFTSWIQQAPSQQTGYPTQQWGGM
ncbi:ADP Ribosylation Factor GTPase-Activating [Abortiporus biennis]